MVTISNYVRAQSLEEAWQLNQERCNCIVGGMLWIKMGKGSISTAIDLCDLGLDQMEESDREFSVGAMVTLRQIEQHPGLANYTCGVMSEALQNIVGVQFRNLATIGGSVWGRFGFSDVLTVLMSMDTYVELYKGGLVSLEHFVSMKYDRDIVVRVIIRKTPGKFTYQSMRIQRTDFPVLNCAVSQVDGEYRTVIGARPGSAILLRDEKGLLSGGINEASAAAFADYIASVVPVGSNLRGSAAYRKHLARVLVDRSLKKLGGMQEWK